MRRLTLLLVLAMAISALVVMRNWPDALGGYRADARRTDVPDPSLTAAPDSGAPARAEVDMAPGGLSTRVNALPAADTPIAHAAEQWRRAAQQGNRVAAQRLVAALDLCAQVIEAERRREDPKLDPGSQLAKMLGRLAAEGRDYCAGYAGDPMRDRFLALLWAAQAGDEEAMKSFVEAPPLPGGKAVANIDLLEAYRDWAPRLALELLRRGDDQIAYTLAIAFDEAQSAKRHTPHLPPSAGDREAAAAAGVPRGLESPLGMVLPADSEQAYRYARLCERAGAQSLRPYCAAIANRVSANLPRAALRAADQWAADEAAARSYRSIAAPWAGREYDL